LEKSPPPGGGISAGAIEGKEFVKEGNVNN
jgi:hypothetical protein